MRKGLLTGLAMLAGVATGAGVASEIQNGRVREKAQKVDKYKGYYSLLNQWLSLKQKKKSLERYFLKHHYQKIAVYGMGELGKRFYEECKETGLELCYAIDRNPSGAYKELDIIGMKDCFAPVDVIVVTAIFDYDEIAGALREKTKIPVVSLEDVVYEADC